MRFDGQFLSKKQESLSMKTKTARSTKQNDRSILAERVEQHDQQAYAGAPFGEGLRSGPDVQAMVDNSPTFTTQRMHIESTFDDTLQRQPMEEEEEEVQGKFATLQPQSIAADEDDLLQGKFSVSQRASPPFSNRTSLADDLNAGIESLTGIDMSDVRVHRNSSKPAQLNALAYTQGNEIHVGPGQERHIPHEAWHAVQQKQGRVRPTGSISGKPLNNSKMLEREADRMGHKALQMSSQTEKPLINKRNADGVIQRRIGFEFETKVKMFDGNEYENHTLIDKEECYRGDNWKIVSDDGNMEFVSDPLDNIQGLNGVLTEMQAFIESAWSATSDQDIRNVAGSPGRWSDSLGKQDLPRIGKFAKDDRTQVNNVTKKTFRGKPQVSVGIEMSKLAEFFKDAAEKSPLTELRGKSRRIKKRKSGKIMPENYAGLISEARKKIDEIVEGSEPEGNARKLTGLWILMASYMSWLDLAKTADMYTKGKLPVMARTDFLSMFNTLSDAEKGLYRSKKDEFLARFPDNGFGSIKIPFTADQWYQSISGDGTQVSREDLEAGGDQTKQVDLMSDPSTVATGTSESMGALNIDRHRRGEKAVFELRAISSYIPIKRMKMYVIEKINTWLEELHQEEQAGL
jgi:hypothetical protein